MATKRIKDISTTATTFAADDFIALDASSVGTRKMAKASLITQVGANYLEKADNLSDVADKDTSKLNLEVPNVGTAANEVPVNGMLGDLAFQSSAGVVVDDLTVDGQLTAAVGKPMSVNGPSMRFDGSNDYVEFADNDAFSFTNGTDDTPFSISAWVKMADAQYFGVLSKNGSTNSLKEWFLWTDASNVLQLWLRDTSGNYVIIPLTGNLNDYVNEWTHISVSYGGAGPNSSVGFASADSAVNFYINGKIATKGTVTYSGTYLGMSNTAQPLTIGSVGGVFAEGEIRDVKLFNKELSAAEVKEVYSNGSLGSVLDARAEQFDTSTGKLYDLSGNDFVGTQSGGVSLLGREFPVYETGTWNGVYSPATGTFATMTMDTSLVYTRIGNLVTVTGFLQTDNVDITGGSGQLQITGLPFAASVVSTCQVGFAWNWGSSFPLSGYIVGSSIRLLTRTSTTARTDNFDVGGMSTGALANRNTMYISATYQIS